jgi:type IV pilus assembly protein PilO
MERFKALADKPWYWQMGVFGLAAVLLYTVFWYFVTSPINDETNKTQEQVEQLRAENVKAQAAAQRINEVRAQYARVQADYEDLKALLPEQRELTNILQGLQDRARGRLTVRRFSPKDDVPQDVFMSKPIEVEVSGSYNTLGQFFADLASYQRIVSITDFKVNQAPSQNRSTTIDAQFLLTAYYIPADKGQLNNAAGAPANAASAKPVSPAVATTTAVNSAVNAATNPPAAK